MKKLTFIICLLLLVVACKKEDITPNDPVTTPPTSPSTDLVADSTYGDYTLVNMAYVDSSGNETLNAVTNMSVGVSDEYITLYQSGVPVEEFNYATLASTTDSLYYDIVSNYGPPCDTYYITHDTLQMHYIAIPTNGVGCYRVLKTIKL